MAAAKRREAAQPGWSAALQMPSPGFALDDENFAFFRDMAKRHAGISLSDSKRNMVFRRVSKRLAALRLPGFAAYRCLLEGGAAEGELQAFINVMTTNRTGFFRESHHFGHLAGSALPEFVAAGERSNHRHLRIWSAGCSTGQEPYTIAMMIGEAAARLKSWDVRILATDIDSDVISQARTGSYSREEAAPVPAAMREKYMRPAPDAPSRVEIDGELRRLTTFNALNLHGDWPMRRKYDAIFCRNVLIYFDKPAQRRLFDRFAELLRDGGYLYVGHSESLYKMTDRFQAVGQSIHRKTA